MSDVLTAGVTIRHFQPESVRARNVLDALASGAPRVTPTPWLVLWGPGAPDRFGPMRECVSAGGHVIALDLAYWDRQRKFRISVDAAHPQAWVMRQDWPASRFEQDAPLVANRWNPNGPIVIAGIGTKARTQYGSDEVLQWELAMATACQQRWSNPVVYRRKRPDAPVPFGLTAGANAPEIDQALAGAALVLTWHSNVAVDAIRLGIPAICRDGAAAAVCASDLPTFGRPQPLEPATRDRFLRNLAWFQWLPSEHRPFWAFLGELLA